MADLIRSEISIERIVAQNPFDIDPQKSIC